MIILPEKNVFRPDEVAKIFSVTPKTIYEWIERGSLEGIRIAGTTIRITRESLIRCQEKIDPFE